MLSIYSYSSFIALTLNQLKKVISNLYELSIFNTLTDNAIECALR